ncbi:MAG TPA: SDR family oxidoreductase [Steroidobacteraceae bacterium]|jgi:3-oxoacyl-[acyl-carrier protein] reductase|nr:SDR family oxidoreductase [Steroidobacteraceae bacterium]
MKIKDKTIVITGAGRGIGRALAVRFAAQGAHIALLDMNATDLAAAAQQCTELGVRAKTYTVDVSREPDIAAALDAVVSDFGSLDVIINNAGIVKDALLIKVKDGEVVGKMSLEQWRAVIDVNLTGVFLCAREAAERMIKLAKGGVIINISSISRHGNAGQSNYSAAKSGVASMTVVWAKELARYGIRVGSIAPGFTHTDILASMKPEVLEKVIAPVPLKRLGQPDEIAHAAQFIIENDFFTGRCLDLDGGLRL